MYLLCFCACASVVCEPVALMEGGEATAVGGVASAQDISLFGEIYSYISDPSGHGGAGFAPTTSSISSHFHSSAASAVFMHEMHRYRCVTSQT